MDPSNVNRGRPKIVRPTKEKGKVCKSMTEPCAVTFLVPLTKKDQFCEYYLDS